MDEESLMLRPRNAFTFGHPTHEFGYILKDPINNKVVRSLDVILFKYENQTIEDKRKPEFEIVTNPSPITIKGSHLDLLMLKLVMRLFRY